MMAWMARGMRCSGPAGRLRLSSMSARLRAPSGSSASQAWTWPSRRWMRSRQASTRWRALSCLLAMRRTASLADSRFGDFAIRSLPLTSRSGHDGRATIQSHAMSDGTIDFWFSTGSTYTYLTGSRLEKVAHAEGVRFNWRPFSVRAIMREQNNIPFANKPIKSQYMWRDIERRAAMYGVEAKVPAPYPLKE